MKTSQNYSRRASEPQERQTTYATSAVLSRAEHSRITRTTTRTLDGYQKKHRGCTRRINRHDHDSCTRQVLDGDNKFLCTKCNEKRDTLKRTCIARLPNVLFLHLKRFEFDMMEMKKVSRWRPV